MIAIVCLGAYLIGSIPFGYLVARAKGVDIFQAGSGNIGATNVGRVLGRPYGVLVFVLDFLKGAIPTFIAQCFEPADAQGWLTVAAALSAFLGHLFPITLGFRGGKGVATGAGAVLVMLAIPTLVGLFAWILVILATRTVSLASIVAACTLAGVQLSRAEWSDPRSLFCLFAVGLVIVKHRTNIARLLQGTESRIKETTLMQAFAKTLHVLALGMWFGMAIFFSFVVAQTLFGSFESITKQPDRPGWFPLPSGYTKSDVHLDGPREQGTRAAGHLISPMFDWYYLIQGVCAFIALATAFPWKGRVHTWRRFLILLALMGVLIGWPLEHKVSELRPARNEATDAYLQDTGDLATMKSARGAFGMWHGISIVVNLATIVFVTGAMVLASRLPHEDKPAA